MTDAASADLHSSRPKRRPTAIGASALARNCSIGHKRRSRYSGREPRSRRAAPTPGANRARLKASGIARILQPARYGGCEASFAGMVDILRTIGQGCGSTAWCLAQYIGHNFMVAQRAPPAQEAVWRDAPDNLVSGILIPLLGHATKVAGGYRLTGQWPFVSGVNNADWCFLSGMVGNADGGVPEERYFLVPRRQITIVQTWDAMGLHGSGSDDVKVADLIVPEHMTLPIGYLKGGETPGNRLHPAPLYRSPSYMWFGILLTSASLGMAEGMLTDYLQEAKNASRSCRARRRAVR